MRKRAPQGSSGQCRGLASGSSGAGRRTSEPGVRVPCRGEGTRTIALLALLLLLACTSPGGAHAQIRLNYQDAELTTVVASLAELAGLNVVFVGGEPTAARVTIKMGVPITTAEVPGLLRTILESAGFVAVERGNILQILPATQAPTLGEMQVFVHTLRHATAAEIAATLAAIYGTGDGGGFDPRTRRSLTQQMRTETGIGMMPGMPGMVQPGGAQPRAALPLPAADAAPAGGLVVGDAVVVPYAPTNSLIIRTTPRNFELLRQTVEQLDARPQQVLIEAFVAEVTLDRSTEFGIDWVATLNMEGRTRVEDAQRFPTFADTTPGGLVVRLAHLGNGFDVRATLRALSADARINVLASPSILARNNEEARILVGSQVPFTQIARSGLAGEVLDRVIQFRDVGTELAIVPTVNQDGYITLHILQQVSTLTDQTLFGAPIITVREAQTSTVVRDRQTVVIGGLIGSERAEIRRGIPILKDIPLLGWLFRDTQRRGRRTELVIFMTPYLVGTDDDIDLLRERSIDRTRQRDLIRRELDRQRLDEPRAPEPARPGTEPPVPPHRAPVEPLPPVQPEGVPDDMPPQPVLPPVPQGGTVPPQPRAFP
jgi:type II secretory pathway component GspD/PulD (secretin)